MGRNENGTRANGALPSGSYEYYFECEDGCGRRGRGAVIFRTEERKLVVTTPTGHAIVFTDGDLDQVEHLRAALAVGMELAQKARGRSS